MKVLKYLAAVGLSATCLAAQAVAIPGLANTGAAGVGVVDNNYRFGGTGTATGTACTVGTGLCGVGADPGAVSYLASQWLPNAASAASTWLAPSSDVGQSYDPFVNGLYTWTMTFDLTGFDVTSASFAGRFLSDNTSTVTLNSTFLASTPATPDTASFSDWTSFSAGGGLFVSGLNTIVFTVVNGALNNNQNPTGLRVEFLSSNVNAVTAVPEPTALLLALAGMGVVAAGMFKRRRAAQDSAA